MARIEANLVRHSHAYRQARTLVRTVDRKITIQISGQWSDAWLYKDHVVLWDWDNHLYSVPTSNVVNCIKKDYGASAAAIAEHAIFRNDWRVSAQLASIRQLSGVEDQLTKVVNELPPVLILSGAKLNLRAAANEPAAGISVDSVLYANRVFTASTDGLFQSYIDPSHPERNYETSQLLDIPVHAVQAKYMSLNASAHENGLWFKPIEWREDGYISGREEVAKIEEYSARTQFLSRDILNYGAETAPQLLRARTEKERPHDRAEYDDWRVFGYGEPEELDTEFQRDLAAASGSPTSGSAGAQVLGNSSKSMLVAANGSLLVVGINSGDRGLRVRAKQKQWTSTTAGDVDTGKILNTQPMGNGFLVELRDEVRFYGPSGSHQVHDGAVARIRTFKDSRRYQDTAVLVRERGLEIFGHFTVLEDDLPPF